MLTSGSLLVPMDVNSYFFQRGLGRIELTQYPETARLTSFDVSQGREPLVKNFLRIRETPVILVHVGFLP